MKLYYILLLVIIPQFICAWNTEIHMMVAQIAYSQLDSTTLDKISNDISIFENFFPNYSDPYSGAVWSDYINKYMKFFSTWHYIDIPYNPSNISGVPNASNINIVWALETIVDSYSQDNNISWDYGFVIRWLLHLLGDIHQPLHNIELYNTTYPKGDQGGNLIKIIYQNKLMDLHSFWDSCAQLYTKSFRFPLTTEEINYIKLQAQNLTNMYPKFNVTDYDFWKWSLESHQLGIDYAYKPLINTNVISQEYLTNARNVCCYQIVKAGYRLAYLLNKFM